VVVFFVETNLDPAAQMCQCSHIRYTFHLHPIRPPMRVAWVQQLYIEPGIITEQEQTFTVLVKATHGIHLRRERPQIREGELAGRFGGELAEVAERFVEEDVVEQVFLVEEVEKLRS